MAGKGDEGKGNQNHTTHDIGEGGESLVVDPFKPCLSKAVEDRVEPNGDQQRDPPNIVFGDSKPPAMVFFLCLRDGVKGTENEIANGEDDDSVHF